jgi:hypothetical protein
LTCLAAVDTTGMSVRSGKDGLARHSHPILIPEESLIRPSRAGMAILRQNARIDIRHSR